MGTRRKICQKSKVNSITWPLQICSTKTWPSSLDQQSVHPQMSSKRAENFLLVEIGSRPSAMLMRKMLWSLCVQKKSSGALIAWSNKWTGSLSFWLSSDLFTSLLPQLFQVFFVLFSWYTFGLCCVVECLSLLGSLERFTYKGKTWWKELFFVQIRAWVIIGQRV